MLASTPSAADLRAQIARANLERYVLAGMIRVHPGRLSAMLNERIPIPVEIAARIEAALRQREP
jgi:plasmid maintenance system antidote protein VapI